MTDLDVARQSALDQVAVLGAQLADVLESAGSTTADDEHDPEGATIGFERAQAQASLDRAVARLAEVDAAIVRRNCGEYGTCVSCGQTIPAERLAARPATTVCVTCAAAPGHRPRR